MFISFVLIVLFILFWVLVGVYSVFSPFTQNIWDVIDFNSAYYGAMAGIERGNLVLKYKSPWFEGSGWFIGSNNFGPPSDAISGSLGKLTTDNNGFSWSITSKTSTIPAQGNGNVETSLASSDSNSFNELSYFNAEKVFLSIDTTPSSEAVYTWVSSFSYFTGGYFTWEFRLPTTVSTAFNGSKLCTDIHNPDCDIDKDHVFDEITVNWTLKWNYLGNPFSIVPNSSIFYSSGWTIDEKRDTMIRETVVNNNSGMVYFGANNLVTPGYGFNPITKYKDTNNLTEHTIISSNPDLIKNKSFNELLTNDPDIPNTTWLQFWFGLINLLRSANGNIYPFLEYQLNFSSPVANTYYTLEGNSVVGNYNVKIIIKKSTNDESPIWDFTIIF